MLDPFHKQHRMDGQRLHRTIVAFTEVRVRASTVPTIFRHKLCIAVRRTES